MLSAAGQALGEGRPPEVPTLPVLHPQWSPVTSWLTQSRSPRTLDCLPGQKASESKAVLWGGDLRAGAPSRPSQSQSQGGPSTGANGAGGPTCGRLDPQALRRHAA